MTDLRPKTCADMSTQSSAGNRNANSLDGAGKWQPPGTSAGPLPPCWTQRSANWAKDVEMGSFLSGYVLIQCCVILVSGVPESEYLGLGIYVPVGTGEVILVFLRSFGWLIAARTNDG